MLSTFPAVSVLSAVGAPACCARGRNPFENVGHLLPRNLIGLFMYFAGPANGHDFNEAI